MRRASESPTLHDPTAGPVSAAPGSSEPGRRAVRWIRWLALGIGAGVIAGFLGGLSQPRVDQERSAGPADGEQPPGGGTSDDRDPGRGEPR